jgi:eukaryotic-like serine/threonine-protein kinase
MRALPGTRIANRFELVRRLADGGMGSVWLAHDLERAVDVAVKVVAPTQSRDREVLARFEREVRISGCLRHENIVRHIDHGTLDDGAPYFVMEYVAGEDLSGRILRTGLLSPAECSSIVGQVSRALGAMHARGIVHRDVKPSNILLEETGAATRVKLADLGLAREQGPSTVTQVNAVVGTPLYMSPERLSGGPAHPSSDLWSLAAVAYHCLSGEPPFHGGNFAAVCIAVAHGKARPVTQLEPSLPAALDGWFARALHQDVTRRFASADELDVTFATACAGPPYPRSFSVRARRKLASLVRFFDGDLGLAAERELARAQGAG